MIIMTGMPGSGKSSYVLNTIKPHGYERINRDTLITKQKCLNETKKLLENKKNIVIDNTNPDKESRNDYIKLAKKYNYNVRSILINVDESVAMHNACYRAYKEKGTCIPEMVYRIYKKKYVKP